MGVQHTQGLSKKPVKNPAEKLTETTSKVPNTRVPNARGLYDPKNEHDSCGVGFVAHIKGERSHQIVKDADHLGCRMDHRGARGAERNTGDGAGIITCLKQHILDL